MDWKSDYVEIAIPVTLWDDLRRIAKSEHQAPQKFVETILREYLDMEALA